ncbi:MAG TPA: Ig-like domain-containing protein, partial [Longimicrobium sp.]
WDVAAGGGSVSPARSFTRADGTAKGQWMLGPRVDSAQAVHLRVAGMDPVAFTAGAVTAGVPLQLAKRGGDGQRGVVGGVLADSLGVVLRMPDGRPVQGAVVDWSVPPEGGTVTPAVSRTDANGAASAAWRLGTGAGLVQATATVDEGMLIFTALTEASAPAQIVAVAGGGEGPVGGAMADSLAVRVTDAHGNPVPGAEVAWAAAGGSGAVQPAVSATDAQGVARAQWTLGLRAGDPAQTASATLGTLPAVAFHATASTRGVTLQFVRTGGDGQTGVVRGVLPDSLSVLLRTPAGLPVQGGTVAWTATAGGGQVSPATSRTDAQGRARAAWTMGAAIGPAQATARMDEGVLTFSAAARVGPPAAMQVLRGSGQSATRGTPVADSLVVRVVDAYGNPVAGAEVRWSVLTGGGRVENASTATRTDGTARTRWAVGYTPGENTAAAAVEGVPAVRFTGTGTAGTLRLNGGGPVSYHRAPGMISTLEVDAIIEVSVTDGQGNRAIRPNLTWALTSEELLPAPEWEPRPRRRWHQQFDEHGISGWVEFEGQRVWFFVPMSSLYGIDLYIPGNRYQATDTVPVDVSLMYVEANYPDDPGRYAEVQLYDDNGWTAEASIGPGLPPVSWPLGTRTGTRTLHACIPESIPGERYCESVTVIVDP